MNPVNSRAYVGASDLDLLIKFAQATTAARWPNPTYMKAGDVVWNGTPGFSLSTDVRLWFDR